MYLKPVFLFAIVTPTLASAQVDSPVPCPNQGETEKAAAGRHHDTITCGSQVEWKFWGKVDASGTIIAVEAGTEGAFEIKATSPADCPYQGSFFSDTLSKCEGNPVNGDWCKSDAYTVTERRFETPDFNPCPAVTVDQAVAFFLDNQAWPTCADLVEVEPITHKSAQQHACAFVDPDQPGGGGGLLLVEGDPRSHLDFPLDVEPDHPLRVALATDDPDAHPAELFEIRSGFAPIEGEIDFSLRSQTKTFDPVSGAELRSADRILTGTIRSGEEYRFLCSEAGRDADSGEPTSILEEWVRDQVGLYQRTHGGWRGLATSTAGGLANSAERLQFPEIKTLSTWMERPFNVSLSRSMAYEMVEEVGATVYRGAMKASWPLNQLVSTISLSPTTGRPVGIEYSFGDSHPQVRLAFSAYRELAPGIWRPLSITEEQLDSTSGLVVVTRRSTITVHAYREDHGLAFSLPTPSSNEWFVEKP
ncbi:hypothetical protein [Engelhardtia mirabilis]|uniref:Uncharacterized protein n=1 Tax=Engelhardtia mirabilis TaxID=2528011 RepID=A0A518BSM3_9BACT|nr:hypothetical protein Pla133_50780 [Planctomycetes bacterium Pla133]QDV04280.1 hypothetical protein Pla86_50750 [Planctomycetes bacterium Pla86]